MAVTTWNVLADGTWGPRVGQNGERTYARRIEAFTDSIDSGMAVLSHSAFPRQYLSQHPDDPFALCVSLEPNRHTDDDRYWTIDYGYSTKVPELAQLNPGDGTANEEPTYDTDNPLAQPPKVRWSTKWFKQIASFTDLDGVVFANAAGELLEPWTKENPRLVLHVQRNLPFADPELLPNLEGGVNDTPVLGYQARRVKCENLSIEIQRDKNVTFLSVSGDFVIGNDGDLYEGGPGDEWWKEMRLNAGYYYWDEANSRLAPIYTVDGQRPPRPVLLNQDGTAPIYVRDGGKPTYAWFRVLHDVPMNSLGLFD